MPQPRILILRAPGTNCDVETAHAFQLAGGQPDVLHLNRLLEAPQLAVEYQVLCVPGGFSYGDDIAAGRIFANQIRHHLSDVLQEFRSAGKLLLGICNGFQVLIKSGLLDTDDAAGPAASLTWNDSGCFMDRWVGLQTEGDKCVFLSGINELYLPIAHAEGKFVTRDQSALKRFEEAGQLVLRYADVGGSVQPFNPNGAEQDVAGMCDTTGRVFGLMPHPERFVDFTQHPNWTRREDRGEGVGLALFRNAVRYFS
ncbi:phosphoribosylformylglycinamidine synthase I [Bythopirellula polymerisocia]|uniref:Phosphoribosylformylglycinamidine synthase n=1 Tax=Bythopirellula polymerisocia TaxID=2528003 RepID=A0A5C6CNP2_9BACT|nr:phosphoribosylformylglycinamidine synthase I [Bythopirellula polymerisocia]TWU25725.1 Phosphoribosylformylglycinamidine synthase [Bythopirellula polymerisocia]